MMPIYWLHWLHAPSLVSIGLSKLKLLSGNWIPIFSNCDLDLDHRHQGSNPKLRIDVSLPYTKFGVNRPKQTKVIEQKLNFYFSNSDLDLDHRHLGSNPKLPLDISYLYSKFGVNRPKQTKVIDQKPKVDGRTPSRPHAADFSITITRISLKTWLIKFNLLKTYESDLFLGSQWWLIQILPHVLVQLALTYSSCEEATGPLGKWKGLYWWAQECC